MELRGFLIRPRRAPLPALLLLVYRAILLPQIQPAPRELPLSRQREQRLEPELARVLDRRGHGLLDAAGCGLPLRDGLQHAPRWPVSPRGVGLRKLVFRSWSAHFELVDLPSRTEVGPKLPLRFPRCREGSRRSDLRRNKPAAKVEDSLGRPVPPASFCGAASARASICACKAFNTDERAGSICSPQENQARKLLHSLPLGSRESVQCQPWESQFRPRFAARNTSP